MAPDKSREQELEEQNELLRQQLEALMGTSKEWGALTALGHGMTQRMAQILYILCKRAPATVSRATFHSLVYGNRDDGGPEPSIFNVHIARLRSLLKRVDAPGKIDTVWGAGYRASPALVQWVNSIYEGDK